MSSWPHTAVFLEGGGAGDEDEEQLLRLSLGLSEKVLLCLSELSV